MSLCWMFCLLGLSLSVPGLVFSDSVVERDYTLCLLVMSQHQVIFIFFGQWTLLHVYFSCRLCSINCSVLGVLYCGCLQLVFRRIGACCLNPFSTSSKCWKPTCPIFVLGLGWTSLGLHLLCSFTNQRVSYSWPDDGKTSSLKPPIEH